MPLGPGQQHNVRTYPMSYDAVGRRLLAFCKCVQVTMKTNTALWWQTNMFTFGLMTMSNPLVLCRPPGFHPVLPWTLGASMNLTLRDPSSVNVL